jgi:prefoldin subunit 5
MGCGLASFSKRRQKGKSMAFVSFNAKYYRAASIQAKTSHNVDRSDVSYLLTRQAEEKGIDYTQRFENLHHVFGDHQEAVSAFEASYSRQSYKHSRGNAIVEGVLAFSYDEAKKELEHDGGKKLLDASVRFAEKMKETYGFEPISVDLHVDEGHFQEDGSVKQNIHAHVLFHNFDHNTGRTILRTMKKGDWEKTQDIAGQACQDVGLSFERGKSKKITKREHMEREEYVAFAQFEERRREIEKMLDKVEDQREEIRAEIRAGEREKEAGKAELKKLTGEIRALKKEREAMWTWKATVRRKSREIAGAIVKKNSGIFGFDREQAEKDITRELEKGYLANSKKAEAHDRMIGGVRELTRTAEKMEVEIRFLQSDKEKLERRLAAAEKRADNMQEDYDRMIEEYEPHRIDRRTLAERVQDMFDGVAGKAEAEAVKETLEAEIRAKRRDKQINSNAEAVEHVRGKDFVERAALIKRDGKNRIETYLRGYSEPIFVNPGGSGGAEHKFKGRRKTRHIDR